MCLGFVRYSVHVLRHPCYISITRNCLAPPNFPESPHRALIPRCIHIPHCAIYLYFLTYFLYCFLYYCLTYLVCVYLFIGLVLVSCFWFQLLSSLFPSIPALVQ